MTVRSVSSTTQDFGLRDEIRRARRERFLDAALECFAQDGFDGTSMERVRLASGMSKGAIYGYFADKEELFLEVLRREAAAHVAEIVAQVEEMESTELAGGVCEALLFAVSRPFFTEAGSFALQPDSFLQAWRSERVRSVLAELYQEYVSAVAGLIERGVRSGEFRPCDAQRTARVVVAAIDGLLLQSAVAPAAGIDQLVEVLQSVLLDGLRKP